MRQIVFKTYLSKLKEQILWIIVENDQTILFKLCKIKTTPLLNSLHMKGTGGGGVFIARLSIASFDVAF
jgi:hypothetical protein